MFEQERAQSFRRDFGTGASYVKFSDAPVAYTLTLEDGAVIADYDAKGTVRGIEFVGGRKYSLAYYRELATRSSTGPQRQGPRPKPPAA